MQGINCAAARVRGRWRDHEIRGTVRFRSFRAGVLVEAEIYGLPAGDGDCPGGFYALHIHEGGSCGGEDFALTGGHYDPEDCPHPGHAGDLPPLLANPDGARMSVYTQRLRLPELLGKTVVIHSLPDDFRTQPSGASGEKIACGVIV